MDSARHVIRSTRSSNELLLLTLVSRVNKMTSNDVASTMHQSLGGGGGELAHVRRPRGGARRQWRHGQTPADVGGGSSGERRRG